MNQAEHQKCIDEFYRLLFQLQSAPGQGKPLSSYSAQSGIPGRGVYFIQDPQEIRGAESAMRIVRVGTHALKIGAKSTLWQRLRQHRGTGSGNGNHRGSIFRLHVGEALINQELAIVSTWGVGQKKPQEMWENPKLTEVEEAWERRVSEYLGKLRISWVNIPDDPSPQSERAFIEQNVIALLSNRMNPLDPPSTGWLGHHSSDFLIQKSGLWNINHLERSVAPDFLSKFERAVDSTINGC